MSVRILTTAELADLPEPTYLLKPFLADRGLTVLFGSSGTFKSFVAIDWSLRVAGSESVIYVAAEGTASLQRRVAAWQTYGLDGDRCIAWVPEPVNLMDTRQVDAFLTAIQTRLAWNPGLLVFDTLHRCMGGADENSAQDVGRALSNLDRIRAELGSAALLIHHSGHGDGERERGSSSLRAAADISVRAKAAGHLQVRLECAKVRDAAEFDPLTVRLLPVDGSLVAASAAPRSDVLEQAVREYMAKDPTASKNKIAEAVTGRREDVFAAIDRVRAGGSAGSQPRNHPAGKWFPTPGSLEEPGEPASLEETDQ
jgi:hypothetical protein